MTDESGSVHTITDGGVAGLHPEAPLPPAIVATAQSGSEHNTLKRAIVPFACWRAHDIRFKFDSSFVLPDIKEEIKVLKALMDEHTLADEVGNPKYKPVLSVFGHADPVGSDDYNKILSGKRAQSIYALLVRDVDLWDDLYQNPQGNDKWEPDVIQAMQSELDQPLTTHPSAAERKALYKAYMDSICTVPDDDDNPFVFQLQKTDFLAGGADPKGKGDYQGCSEFNPGLIFSDQQNQQYSDPDQKAARDKENADNRRVLVFLFRPGLRINPTDWPCPRAKEGVGDCKKRFWSDGENRRSTRLPDKERQFKDTKDTFACRFYQRLATNSPCEDALVGNLKLRILDDLGQPRTALPYKLEVDDRTIEDVTDGEGFIKKVISYALPRAKLTFDNNTVILILHGLASIKTALGAQQRLANLGFLHDKPGTEMNARVKQAINEFQAAKSLPVTGNFDPTTTDALVREHGS